MSMQAKLLLLSLLGIFVFRVSGLNLNLLPDIDEHEPTIFDYSAYLRKPNSAVDSKIKIETLGAVLKGHIKVLKDTPNKEVDIVFLVDSSTSVGKRNFIEELKFVKKLLSDFTVDPEFTRVAVITYSSKERIIRQVNYLEDNSQDRHKCSLLEEDLRRIAYSGGGTYTLGAFLEAREVLKHARATANKAIFLVTDGFSNGGDPRPLAKALRQEGVKIYTFGIQNGNVQELLDMASNPKNESCYILDSFTEFEALARRALHEDLTIGRYIPQVSKKCRRLCVGRDCCDSAAVCNCGIHTGKYECVCPPGYYGNGLKGGCHACPSGTFKPHGQPGDAYTCQACPDEHQITTPGATAIEQCVCRKGYRNFNGTGCAVLRCPELDMPQNGYFVNDNCKNVLNAACGLTCKPGYELRGSSLRICREDGTWSGTDTQCIMKTCPALVKPKNGNMICTTDDFTFNTVCRFTCDTGYKLVGSRKRTCLAISFWTGINTRCREIVCQPLPYLRDGKITEQCTADEVPFGTTCNLECHAGYTLIGPHTLQCTPKGMWIPAKDGLVSQCVDTSSPFIMCPSDIETQTDPDEATAEVSWVVPLAVDNSGYIPILTSVPAAVPPTRFPIGMTKVTYIAEDLSKNKAECSFYILVRDNQPPTIDRCFSPLPVVSSEAYAEVMWETPLFSDNSGQNVRVQRSHAPGLFHKGKTDVTYTATDASGNINKCVVTVNIIPHPCEFPPTPINGNRSCYEDEEGVVCRFACREDYAFAVPPAEEYHCAFDNVWEPRDSLPIPDCSVKELSNDILQPAALTFAGDIPCKQRHALIRLESEFEQRINTRLTELCEGRISCYIDDLETTCEQQEEFNKIKVVLGRNKRSLKQQRRKRSAETSERVTETEQFEGSLITFSYMLTGSVQSTGDVQSDLQQQHDLVDSMKTVVDTLKTDTKEGKFNMEINGKDLELADMSYDTEPQFNCEPGSVLDGRSCLKCPMGMFFNVMTEQCEACPKGTFQPLEGQLTCVVCPGNTSTIENKATSSDMCKAMCLPGTFSDNGLEMCETCRKGYFQPKYGQTECEKCPRGYKTLKRGSRTEDRCHEKCPAGHVSKTGLRPCFPCPLGTYQNKEGRSSCYICPGNVTTTSKGSDDILDCENFQADAPQGETPSADGQQQEELLVDECFDDPCLNGGTCVPGFVFGFDCECVDGYTGVFCQDEINECGANPCLNDGTCVDLLADYGCQCQPGFTGKKCESNINDCAENPCVHGVCEDGIQDYRCQCDNGYEGRNCDININECAPNPCLNGGTCTDEVAGYTCTCPEGIEGDLCDIDIDECTSNPCQNEATCVDEPGGYSCICDSGFEGDDCEVDINECDPNPCAEGSKCEDLRGTFQCHCAPGYSGDDCSQELELYYQLDFPATASTMDYARLSVTPDLNAVTACFWMKTGDSQNQGTPFSYASVEGTDNAFTLSDPDGFAFYVNGEKISTNVKANDDVWHHICVLWSSNRGSWKIYMDGVPEDSGRNLANGQTIKGGGVFVIGQEQDSVGGGFSSPESFIGKLTQMNVWSRELSLSDIESLRLSCEKQLGDVIAWPDVSTGLHGMTSGTPVDFCKDCPVPSNIDYGEVTYDGLSAGSIALYQCPRGFNVAGRAQRQCLVTGEWEGQEPTCQRVACGYPGPLANGWIEGNRFTFDNRIRYICNKGYNLKGDSTRYCGEFGFWEGEEPVCEQIKCVIPPLSENTRVIDPTPDNKYLPGTDVFFQCTPGNRMYTEHDNVYCQRDGTFDRSIPTCDPQTCRSLPTVVNGILNNLEDLDEYPVGYVLQFDCKFGYELSPNALNPTGQVSCLPSGQWDANLPECRITQCPTPQTILNGRFEMTGQAFLDQVDYTCNTGYEISGASLLECYETGEWDPQPPECLPVSCGRPDRVIHGSFTADRYTFEGTATYICDLGYIMVGESVRNCLANSSWSGEAPVCKPISCGKPESVENGEVIGREYTLNNIVRYECSEGYTLVGSSERVCRETGRWQNDVPSCTRVECDYPPVVENGFSNGVSFFYGDSVSYGCNDGFHLEGESTLTCGSNRAWIPAPPVCEANKCNIPPNIDYGLFQNPQNLTTFDINYVLQYECNVGYEFSPNSINPLGQIQCLISGLWEANLPVCEIIECFSPPEIDNGIVSFSTLTYLSIATYQCNDGYELEGKAVRTCQEDKVWSGSLPICNAIMCLPPPVVDNGRLDYKDLQLGSVVRYVCAEGHYLTGQEVRRCLANLSFSGEEPQCLPVKCEDPGEVEFATRLLSGLQFQSTVSYACRIGYSMVGESMRVCTKDAVWSGTAPVCEIIQCDKPSAVISNGRMRGEVFTYQAVISYVCDEGYFIEGLTNRTCLANGDWDIPIPVCEAVECPRLSLRNGFTSTFETGFGTTVSISCQSGYKLVGPSEKTCLSSGAWSGEDTICIRYQCPRLNPPVNGQVLVRRGEATYDCLPGFVMNGPKTRVCQEDETWSLTDTTCDPILCPDITSGGFLHGSMTYDQLTYGSSIIFDCERGFILAGERKLDCLIDGSWSGEVPVCERVKCFEPFQILFSKIIGDDYYYNSTITYECETGYRLIGDSMRTCLAEGFWSGVSPRCELIVCPRPIPGAFVKISGSSNNFGSTIAYSCIPGFELDGPETRTCQSNGEWSDSDPSCLRVECPAPPELKNGRIYAPSYDQGSRITYECNEGYRLVGLNFRLCLASKQWTGSNPTCVKVKCPTPPSLLNGVIIGENWKYGDSISYECVDGYDLVGEATRVCLSVGQWSGANPSCIKVSCGPPPLPSNAIFKLPDDTDEGTFGANATLECEEGFLGVGTNYQFCQANGAWSQSNFRCEVVYCPSFATINNGRVVGSSNEYGSDLELQCDEGYSLQGESRITCTADGSWSYVTEPQCIEIICARPVLPSNGRISPSASIFNIGERITYECDDGYKVSGPTYRVCQKDGMFDGLDPYCQLVVCYDPPEVSNSLPIDLARRYLQGDEIRYICDTGYFLSEGDQVLSCSRTGAWAGAVPFCSRIQCGRPSTIINGKISSTGEDYDSVATYTCNDGFTLKGSPTSRCQLSGSWSNTAPTCVPVSCGAPPTVPNSITIDTEEHTYNSVVTYICDSGYRLTGEQSSSCGADGTWSGIPPTCEPITCSTPPIIPHAQYTGDDLRFRSVITYVCVIGYQLVGEASLTCSANGLWVGERPHCEQVSCGPPPVIPHASTTMTMGPNFGSFAVFMCNDGYYLVGSSKAICTADQQWEYDIMPSCEPEDCGPLQPLPFTSLLVKDTTFGSVAVYYCEPGYYYNSATESVLTCDKNGNWKGDFPDCIPVDCGYPPDVEHTLVTGRDYSFGNSVIYECSLGYQLLGDSELICTASGDWSGQIPNCLRIDCGPLPLPQNGNTIFGDVSTTTFSGDSVEFACDEGYELSGSSILTCQMSGKWDGEVPACDATVVPVELTCPPETGVSNAQLVTETVAVGADVTLTCVQGYEEFGDTSIHCQEDQTWSRPTGGCRRVFCGKPRLRDFVNVVRISGRSYFYGDQVRYWCRAGVPPARSPPTVTCTEDGTWNGEIACGVTCKLPCKNGGICLGLNQCKCPTGYGGRQCQLALCVLPCLNGGTCVSPYKCACPQGYEGIRCQRAVCEQPCQNGGRCVRPNRCKCTHGYRQPFCAEKRIP